MYKVLLVDDEPFITEGLADAVDWSAYGLELVGSSEDGEQALERLQEVPVDLLITDISMPIMTGLELIRRARMLLPQLKVIILSGYNEFDYLKEGMQLGIENYLLKPIRFEELEATLTDTVRKLNADKPMPVFGQDELGIIRDNVLTRWVNGRIGLPELAERTGLLGIDLSQPFVALAIVRCLPDVAPATGDIHGGRSMEQSGLLLAAPEQLISEAGMQLISFHNEDGDWVIACCIYGMELDGARLTETLERLIEQWSSRDLPAPLPKQLPVRIAVGKIVPMADAAASYAQARKTQQFFLVLPHRKLLHYDEISTVSATFPEGLLQWEAYAKPIVGKDREELLRLLAHDFAAIRAADGLNPVRAKGAAVELIILMKMEVDKLGRADAASVFKERLDQTVAANVLDEVEVALQSALLFTADAFTGEDMSPVIKQALRYIQVHYAEALTLKSLGLLFHIHPNYLGQLFHKQTGDTFTDYLNKFRIEKAKQLLRDSRLKVNEIARQVGYWETGYFYKQFKKHVGMVPGDYKDLL